MPDKWIHMANSLQEQDRKEIAAHHICQKKMSVASDLAFQKLTEIPGATNEMIQKIFNYTITVSRNPCGLYDANCLFKAYLPHLENEIKKLKTKKTN
jgi:hypothetical protein